MASSRCLSSFELTAANNQLRISNGIAPTTITLTAGTYWHENDGSADDILKELKTRVEAAYAGTLTVRIYGVLLDGAGAIADGRILYTHSTTDLEFLFADGATTVDPRIFGFGANSALFEGLALDSDYAHRYGWYPQREAYRDLATRQLLADTAMTSRPKPARHSVVWGEQPRMELAWDNVPSALVREAGAVHADRAAEADLTGSDPNASLERFALDIATTERVWRFYPLATSTATYHPAAADGDGYTFPNGSPLWTDPLGRSSMTSPIGERWDAGLEGVATDLP